MKSRAHAPKQPQRPPDLTSWIQPAAIGAAALAGAAWFLHSEHEIAGAWGYSLDDSWIYATYAKNVATGHGYAFNPGEHIAGATGPLYVYLLALIYLVFQDVVLPVKILGVLCLAASGILVHRIVRRILPDSRYGPLVAGVLVGCSPPLLWGALSGLEVPEYLLIACLGLYGYVRSRWTLAVAIWSIGVWLRPDGMLLVLLGIALRPRIDLRSALVSLAVAAAIIGPYLAFNEMVGGSLLPNSVSVSHGAGSGFFADQWNMGRQVADLWGIARRSGGTGFHAPLLIPGIVVGSVLMARNWPVLVTYALAFPFALALYRPWSGQFSRYIVYAVPFGMMLAVIGYEWACRRALGSRCGQGVLFLGAICLAWQVYEARVTGISHGWNVQNINGMQRFVAESVRRSTSPGDTVAVNDVGAMGYFSGCYVVDLVGLVSPRMGFPEYLRRYRPKYLIVFPEWFRAFVAVDEKTKQIVFYDADSTYKYSPYYGVRLKKNTIAARNTMYFFERMPRGETGPSSVQLVVH